MDSESDVYHGYEDSQPRKGLKRSAEDSDNNESEESPKEDDINFQSSSSSVNSVRITENNSAVVAQHYNKLQEKGLAERFLSKIYHMRNFNNWVKSMLIQDYLQRIKDSKQYGSPLRVLDICCGKGGDLLKWQKGDITYLICTDIAELSIEQCRARYDNSPPDRKTFKAEFFTADATRDRLRNQFNDPSIELNLVSCQFAFHYCFESPKQAENMLRNVSECLRVGGYFIGTIPDAYDIMRRQREAQSDTFGNDIYEIKFLSDPNDLPIFGAKYNFHLNGVVDCPEFLVYFPALVKLAKKFNLELVEKARFDEYFDMKVGVKGGRDLLNRMKALEPYGQFDNRNLSQDGPNEYQHATDYLKQREGYDRKKCGTLSASEWEAISLYMVFAFKKVKPTTV